MQEEEDKTESASPLVRAIIAEPTVLTVIAVNTLAVFLSAFPQFPEPLRAFFRWVDYGCVCYFVIEALMKVRTFGFAGYWSKIWNRFDLFIVLASVPLLMTTPVGATALRKLKIFTLFRVGRFLRFLRLVRFVPDAPRLWRGTLRAIRASIGVFIVLLVLNLVLAMGANILFSETSDRHFGDPLTASYTLFKVFTVEGWHEIPDEIIADNATAAADSDAEASLAVMTRPEKFALRGYFIISVLVGGILGLSLANAVFVDEMMMDNNQELEQKVDRLQEEIMSLKSELLEAVRGKDRPSS